MSQIVEDGYQIRIADKVRAIVNDEGWMGMSVFETVG